MELKALRKLVPGRQTDELNDFYNLSARIVELNTAVLEGVLSHPSAAKLLSTGRVIILMDAVSALYLSLASYGNLTISFLCFRTAFPIESCRLAQICSSRCLECWSDRRYQTVLCSRVRSTGDSSRCSR